MRTAFIETLFDLAKIEKKIILITGDLGFGVFNRFMHELPQQFVNAGVAEQNMIGLAVGMALSKKIVFTYSIANFSVMRCLEQIRNDVCYHKANVKIVSVGGGMAYGALSITHHATEDIAVIRALPNLTVIAPNDPVEVRFATRAIVDHIGPCYLRLGRAGETTVHRGDIEFQIGKAIVVRKGNDLTIIVAGGLLKNAIQVADILNGYGLQARILSMHTIKPLDLSSVINAAKETKAIFTLEEHSIIGGLGSAVAEILKEASDYPVKFKRIGLNDAFPDGTGDQEYMRSLYGLDISGILAVIKKTIDCSAGERNKRLKL